MKRSFSNYGYGIQMSSESRKHSRKPYFNKVRFSSESGTHEGSTKNISASGIFIATEEKLAVGQQLKLNLPLKDGKTADIIGRIAWINEEGFGLKFKKVC